MQEVADIRQRFNFSRNYINDCLRQLEPHFEGHVSRGTNNRLLFDSSAVALFEQISNWKDLGKTLPQIRRKLDEDTSKGKQPPANTDNAAQATPTNDDNSSMAEKLLSALLEKDKAAATEKEKRLTSQQQTIAGLTQRVNRLENDLAAKEERLQHYDAQIKLLPDGRTPEEIRRDWETMQEVQQQLAAKLQQRDKQITRQEQLRTLLVQLHHLERSWGLWGKGAKRRALLEQIEALEADMTDGTETIATTDTNGSSDTTEQRKSV